MASPAASEAREAPDWAEVYTTLISHTSLRYDEIAERTIPQIEAILRRLGKHISLKLGMPAGFEEESNVPSDQGRAPKLSELMAFCEQFDKR